MVARFGLTFVLALTLSSSTLAQTVIVQENFDQYATREAFLAQWVPAVGNGGTALATSDPNYLAGLLTDDSEFPSAIPDVQGKGVDHLGAMVNQYGGAFDPGLGQTPDFTINPSATENVFLSADIFVGTSGNERMSVGLRATLADGADADLLVDTQNLIELGSWNANPTVLNIPGTAQVSANFAFRAQLFTAGNPDWQYFALPPELDRVDDADAIVNVGDTGAGWHTYAVTISDTQLTFTIDLFRDGVRNTVRDENGVVVGEGVAGEFDGEVVIDLVTRPSGFNNLRVGSPSGVTSTGTGLYGFDNILLQLQSSVVAEDDADFDGDGDVDGADFLTWQQNLGISDGSATLAMGDANDDGNVTDADLDVWETQFGPGASTPAVGSIPEPATVALAAMAMFAGLAACRRR